MASSCRSNFGGEKLKPLNPLQWLQHHNWLDYFVAFGISLQMKECPVNSYELENHSANVWSGI